MIAEKQNSQRLLHEAESFVRAISCDFVDRACPRGEEARTD
jgi:hypothetical protein